MSTPVSKPVQIVQPIISQQSARQHLGNQFRPLQNVSTSQSTPIITSQAPIMHQNVNIMNINMPQMTQSKSGETLSNSQQFAQQINILPGTVLQLPDGRLVMPQQSNQTIFLQLPPNSSSSPYQSANNQALIQSLTPQNNKNNFTQVPPSSISAMKQTNDQAITMNSPIAYPKLAPATPTLNTSVSSSESIPQTLSGMTPPNIVGNSPEDILSKLDSEISNLESLPNKSDYHQNHYKHLKEIRAQVDVLIKSKSTSLPNSNSSPSAGVQFKPIPSVSQSPMHQSRSPSNNPALIRPSFAPLRPRVDTRPLVAKNESTPTDKKAEPNLLPLNEERKQEAVNILSQLNLYPCQPIPNSSAVLVEFRLHSKRFLLKMSRQQKVNLEGILIKSPPQKQFDILQIIQQEQNETYGPSEPPTKMIPGDSQNIKTLRKPINETGAASSHNHLSPVQKLAPLQKPLFGDPEMSRNSSLHNNRPPIASNSPARIANHRLPIAGSTSEALKTNATNLSPTKINPRIIKAVQSNNLCFPSQSSTEQSAANNAPRVNLKVAHLKRMLHADQQLALHPNTRVAFRNESNALLRLLCFHVFQDNNRTNDLSVLKADQVIKKAETAILQKKDFLLNNAKSLLMKIGLEGDAPIDAYCSDKILVDLDCDLLEEEKSQLLAQQKIQLEEASVACLDDTPNLSSQPPQDRDLPAAAKVSTPIVDCATTLLDESLETNAMQDDQSSMISDSIKTEDTVSIAVKDECCLFEESDAGPHKKQPRLDNCDEFSSTYTQNHLSDSPSYNHISSSQNYFDEILESLAKDDTQSDIKHSEDPDVDAAIRSILF